ncbi:DNA topoisomerase IB [Flindersiella endophytica]
MRLRRSDCSGPGIRRRRRGRGFSYKWDDGTAVDDAEVRRIEHLVVPPAWKDVWICPHHNGHLQAVGTDTAGRRQYLYHPAWREKQDAIKHDHVLVMARALPKARRLIDHDLRSRGLNQRRVLAAAGRLLDLGFFRVGGDEYAENGSYGLATLRRDHVTIERGGTVTFHYAGKGGTQLEQGVADPGVIDVLRRLLRRNDPSPDLLAYWQHRAWHDVHSSDINTYLQDVFGREVSAKDFRTWHATVLAAVGLAVSGASAKSQSARKRAVARVMREVAGYLGNTPAVARTSYVDPRLVDRFTEGRTIAPALPELGKDVEPGRLATEGAAEQAVLRLLS